ncbi:hypothetical protein Holit_01041 [Hollandina sp. SP2]
MDDIIEFVEVPHLEEIMNYLPISAVDKEDVSLYLKNITNLVNVNYKYEQYQFAYFGLHLLYMTYIYSTVWKISKVIPNRYEDATVFARTYRGSELDFLNIESIFEYSLVPEKELPKILRLIGLDDGQLGNISGLVDTRNDMAHASGKFEIPNDIEFASKANSICTSIRNIHKCMINRIKTWYQDILLKYCSGEFGAYTDNNDFIFEQMIQNFNLSVNELLVCNEMSINKLPTTNPAIREKLRFFKKSLKTYCENQGYVP